MGGSDNKGCLLAIIAALAIDAIIAAIVILFIKGEWQWATGIICFIAAALIIAAIAIKWRNHNRR